MDVKTCFYKKKKCVFTIYCWRAEGKGFGILYLCIGDHLSCIPLKALVSKKVMKLYLSNDIYTAGVHCLVDGTKLASVLGDRGFSFNPFLLMKCTVQTAQSYSQETTTDGYTAERSERKIRKTWKIYTNHGTMPTVFPQEEHTDISQISRWSIHWECT